MAPADCLSAAGKSPYTATTRNTFRRLRHDYASILLKVGVKDRITEEDHFAAAQAVQNWIEKALA
jgi:hypothetical protein